MTQEELIDILKKVLKTDANLDFLLRLTVEELETLVVCIREREEYPGKVDSSDKKPS
jgi:hypothetical protein